MDKHRDVDGFLASLDPDRLVVVEALRSLISEVEPTLTETIKWNAPNYVHRGEDRITFNVAGKGSLVRLILHMGATRPEDKNGQPVMPGYGDLIDWSSDIRGAIGVASLDEVEAKRSDITRALAEWLTIG